MPYIETKTSRKYTALLRKWQGESGLKQGDIADKTGIAQPSVSSKLSGKQEVSADDFFHIAEACGVNAIAILEQATEKQPVEKQKPIHSPGVQAFYDDPLTQQAIAKGLIAPELIAALELLDSIGALGDERDVREKFGSMLVWSSNPPQKKRR